MILSTHVVDSKHADVLAKQGTRVSPSILLTYTVVLLMYSGLTSRNIDNSYDIIFNFIDNSYISILIKFHGGFRI